MNKLVTILIEQHHLWELKDENTDYSNKNNFIYTCILYILYTVYIYNFKKIYSISFYKLNIYLFPDF